jgi:ABC-type sulfate transport system permease component
MNREIRHDPAVGQRLTAAGLLFGGAMITLGTVLAWIVLRSRDLSVTRVDSLVILVIFLAAAIATVNLLVAYGRLRWFYRCPQCAARVPRVPEAEAGTRIRYQCTACSVDWDTGWSETDAD